MVTLTVNKILLAPGVQTPPTVDLLIAEFYGGSFTSFATGVVIDASGNVVGPHPSVPIDPTKRYILRSINNMCAYQYDQDVSVTISCPIGYTLNGPKTECYQEVRVAPTVPTNVGAASARKGDKFNLCGSYIFSAGYASNGTGSTIHISTGNAFWLNGVGDCVTGGNMSNGPFNRAGVWEPVGQSDQFIGYSICQSDVVERTYYIGVSSEYGVILRLNGVDIFDQNLALLDAQFGVTDSVSYAFMIYPLTLPANQLNVIEVLTHEADKPSMALEIYNNTSPEIQGATGYGDLNLIFSTKDMIGLPAPISNYGFGYICPSGYALEYCASPPSCYRRTSVTPTYS